jgi:ketosteroid isomerase-like protein
MSSENEELARRAFAALERRDIEGFLEPVIESVEGFPPDATIARARVVGTAAQSGLPLEQARWQVARVPDGRVSGWAWYRTEAEAREALGLPA